uniref:Uncharacterized protein n=1 Tax=Arundo donax TaxID=35708 RepID=A0A0A9GNQ6_ARUDO
MHLFLRCLHLLMFVWQVRRYRSTNFRAVSGCRISCIACIAI